MRSGSGAGNVFTGRIGAVVAGAGTVARGVTARGAVAAAFVPAVVLGLLFGKAIKAHLFTPVVDFNKK